MSSKDRLVQLSALCSELQQQINSLEARNQHLKSRIAILLKGLPYPEGDNGHS